MNKLKHDLSLATDNIVRARQLMMRAASLLGESREIFRAAVSDVEGFDDKLILSSAADLTSSDITHLLDSSHSGPSTTAFRLVENFLMQDVSYGVDDADD